MAKLPITVLISGTGTNLQALIDAQSTSTFQIVRVISNKKYAKGLQRAKDADIPTAYHNILSYKGIFPNQNDKGEFQEAREQYDADLASLIEKDKPSLVVCAGFMHILSAKAIEPLEQAGIRIINLHPGMFMVKFINSI
jgi:phosphoribosylglycinamide formyltransferase